MTHGHNVCVIPAPALIILGLAPAGIQFRTE